jgi:hypothetical protein
MLAAAVDLKLELKPVALVESREAGALDSRDVHERVGLAVVSLDETEALHRVEELDRAAGLFAGQLALRSAAGTGAAAAALDRHWFAFNAKVGRRYAPAAIDERKFERLAVGEVGEARLLDRRDVDEDVLATVIADDEAEAFLRVEEFDDALAFADDLGRHSASTAATKTATTAAAAAAESTAAAATAAVTIAAATTAEAAAIAETATAAAGAEAPALLEGRFSAEIAFVAAETVALVPAASAAVALAPSIETHAPSEY